MKNLVRTFIAPYFAFAVSVCSIVGLVIILLSNKNATIVALMAFCLFLLIILTGVLLGIARMLHQNYGKDYKGKTLNIIVMRNNGTVQFLDFLNLTHHRIMEICSWRMVTLSPSRRRLARNSLKVLRLDYATK